MGVSTFRRIEADDTAANFVGSSVPRIRTFTDSGQLDPLKLFRPKHACAPIASVNTELRECEPPTRQWRAERVCIAALHEPGVGTERQIAGVVSAGPHLGVER